MSVPIANIMEPADWQDREMERLEAENAKLREQLEYDRQTSRSRAELIDRLKAENAKLRELVARLICHIENPPCEGCMAEMSCAGGEGLTNCDEYQFMVCDARKLGVEI